MTLSIREQEIMDLVVTGATNKEIAKTLGIEYTTVRTHLQNIYLKMSAKNRAHAAVMWIVLP